MATDPGLRRLGINSKIKDFVMAHEEKWIELVKDGTFIADAFGRIYRCKTKTRCGYMKKHSPKSFLQRGSLPNWSMT